MRFAKSSESPIEAIKNRKNISDKDNLGGWGRRTVKLCLSGKQGEWKHNKTAKVPDRHRYDTIEKPNTAVAAAVVSLATAPRGEWQRSFSESAERVDTPYSRTKKARCCTRKLVPTSTERLE